MTLLSDAAVLCMHTTPLLLCSAPAALGARSSLPTALLLRGGASPADYYDILGVQRDATQAEIKRAYRRQAIKLHPDKNPSPDANEQFIQLGRAFETLKDPRTRAQYDLFGSGSGSSSSSGSGSRRRPGSSSGPGPGPGSSQERRERPRWEPPGAERCAVRGRDRDRVRVRVRVSATWSSSALQPNPRRPALQPRASRLQPCVIQTRGAVHHG